MEITIGIKAKYNDTEVSFDCTGCTDEDAVREMAYEELVDANEDLADDDGCECDTLEIEVENWGDLEDYEALQDIETYYEINDTSINYDLDVVEAAVNCDVELSDIDEAYQGEFKDDEDFVQNLLEDIGDIPSNLPSYIHIDWERTASDVMCDYCEYHGHYFRML